MAPLTNDEQVLHKCFRDLKELQKEIQQFKFVHAPCTELSMGMLNTLKLLLQEVQNDLNCIKWRRRILRRKMYVVSIKI